MSSLTSSLIINGVILFAVLESDFGPHRKLGWFRVARPLMLSIAIVPFFLESFATTGTGLALEIAGVAAGVLGGLAASALMRVSRNPRTGKPATRAGISYAALWIAIIGARSAFSYGSSYWFAPQLGTWMHDNDVSSAAITNALVLMAVAMMATRTLAVARRWATLPAAAEGNALPVYA